MAKIEMLRSLQDNEYKTYNSFLIILEKQIKEFSPNINQPDLLNEMVKEKNRMMRSIDNIEEELGPLRKEIADLSARGKIDGLDSALLNQIKQADIQIIELISRISRIEKQLTDKIKDQMVQIKNRLTEIKNRREISQKYDAQKVTDTDNNKKREKDFTSGIINFTG